MRFFLPALVKLEAFRFELEADLANGAMADAVEKGFQQGLGQAKLREQSQPDLAKLLKALNVERRGNHFEVVFELREPVIEQARDVGVLAGLGFYGVRRYLQNAKSAEANGNIAQLTRLYAVSLHGQADTGKRPLPRKLVSLPAVPASVPRGVKYQSSPEDWNAWAPIHFGLTEPQYYQYEVVAAKDGKTAEIQLDPKTGEISAVDHSEEQPLE